MRSALGTVDKAESTVRVCYSGNLGNGIDSAEDIADMSHGDDARAVGHQRTQGVHIEAAVGVDGDYLDDEAAPPGRQLPGHYIAVVLHDGEDYLVAGLHALRQARGHEVDALGGAAGENHLGGVRSAYP